MVDRSFAGPAATFFLCLWLFCVHWMGEPRAIFAQVNASSIENPLEGPVMVLPETKFDFGEADEGSSVSHDFIVRNTGSAPLQISKVSPD